MKYLTIIALFFASALSFGAEVECSISAEWVADGAAALDFTAEEDIVLSGFYIRLTNGVAPRENPIVAALEINGQPRDERVAISALPRPAIDFTRPFTHGGPNQPIDVAREYRCALSEPLRLKMGDNVVIKIESCKNANNGVTAGLQFCGTHQLSKMRSPFRAARTNGPVCSIPWTQPEVIAVGTQKKFDPLCAPQNNSSIIGDADGTLWQFTAYYSVDEQYGGGRGGSFSRIYGYKKSPNAEKWELVGCVADLMETSTYSGDPFVFRDLNGKPSLVFCTCDGTNGFADWQIIGLYLIQSETDSFAGPWTKPKKMFDGYPREPDDNKTGGRANCVRIFPRERQGDYLFVWNHGAQDMDIRGLVIPSLNVEITHEQINSAPIFVRNQEEGGGGFTYKNRGYYSTWQIPWLNDPNGLQRVYEIDLDAPLDGTGWRAVSGSLGSNDGANEKIDGGNTADAWAVSLVGDRLWATACEYSATENKNYLTARSCGVSFDTNGALIWPTSGTFRWGAVRPDAWRETYPTVEYALGKNGALEFDFVSHGEEAYGFIALAPSEQPKFRCGVVLEFARQGTRLVEYSGDDSVTALTDYAEPCWREGEKHRLKLIRAENRLTAQIDGVTIHTFELTAEQIMRLSGETRFKLAGWRGSRYEISDAVLTDGAQ